MGFITKNERKLSTLLTVALLISATLTGCGSPEQTGGSQAISEPTSNAETDSALVKRDASMFGQPQLST